MSNLTVKPRKSSQLQEGYHLNVMRCVNADGTTHDIYMPKKAYTTTAACLLAEYWEALRRFRLGVCVGMGLQVACF